MIAISAAALIAALLVVWQVPNQTSGLRVAFQVFILMLTRARSLSRTGALGEYLPSFASGTEWTTTDPSANPTPQIQASHETRKHSVVPRGTRHVDVGSC